MGDFTTYATKRNATLNLQAAPFCITSRGLGVLETSWGVMANALFSAVVGLTIHV